MAVQSVYWGKDRAKDIHLVPGMMSPRLDQLLMIGMPPDEDDVRADQAPPGVSVVFTLNLPGGAPPWFSFDASIGVVTFASPPPAGTRVLDFLVSAGASEAGHATDPTYIRFHMHAGLTSVRLAPGKLTMRQLAKNVFLTVLAEFTDGTHGDITNWSSVDPFVAGERTFARLQSQPSVPVLVWSVIPGAFPAVSVDPNTGLLANPSTTAADEVMVEMRPLPASGNRKATADVIGAARWSAGAVLHRIDGPGFGSMNEVPNVLILPDGFTENDKPDFDRLAAQIVEKLCTRKRTRPFDIFKGLVNYFSAWVASPEGGVSPLPLVVRYNLSGTQADAQAVETGVALVDVPASATIAAPSTPATNIRFLLHDRDTAFHVVMGERPQAEQSTALHGCRFNKRRLDHDDFDEFLGGLKNKAGIPVGSVWQSYEHDSDLIVILCRSNAFGGENNSRSGGSYICMTLASEDHHRIEEAPAGPGLDLIPDTVPAKVSVDLWTTAAHELCHSFGIDDEYGGGDGLPDSLIPAVRKSGNLQARADLLTGGQLDADKVLWRWPRIAKAGLLYDTPTPVGAHMRFELFPGAVHRFNSGDIVRLRTRPLFGYSSGTLKVVNATGDELEIEPQGASTFNPAEYAAGSAVKTSDASKTGMLIAPPISTGTSYHFDLEAGHDAFAINDEVELSARPSPSGRFKVLTIAGDELECEPVAGTTIDPLNFPTGSIVMAPRRAPDPDPDTGLYGDDLELIHTSTRARINLTDNPLNAKDTDPADRACDLNNQLPAPTPATNYPGGKAPKPPRYSSWIVGLYENGGGYNCGIYHPTGVCTMKRRSFRPKSAKSDQSYQFCPICRYAMVDRFDPTRHGDIDDDYDPRYPK